MQLPELFRFGKHRRYPIKRDKGGRSLRERCFELFDQGKRPVEVAKELKMKEATVFRYFRDWQRLGPNFEKQYTFIKGLLKKDSPDRDKDIELFARTLGIEKEEFETVLSKPHGLRRLMKGKLRFPAHTDIDHKLHIAFSLAIVFSDHLIKKRGSYEDVYYALGRYLQEHKKYRDDIDVDVQESNKEMEFIHKILAVEMENERTGRNKPDLLSEQEREVVMRLGIEREMKIAEMVYWFQIGILMTQGLTREQAREKMYQGLVDKGDLIGAKMLREFQNKVHHLKVDEQGPPPGKDPPTTSPK